MKRRIFAFGAWLGATLVVACSNVTNDAPGGTGGTSGLGGAGGMRDAAVAPLTCEEAEMSCFNGRIDPIQRSEDCPLADPPDIEDACEGAESQERPLTCTRTGNATLYRLTSARIAEDCNLGYDLDGCDGNTCLPGEDAAGEGENGVDNALAGLASLATLLGTNLGVIDQALYDELCLEKTIVRFEVDPNPDEGCATVTTFVDEEVQGTIRLNLSESGCLSGELGTIPLELGGAVRALDNAVGHLTLSDQGLANGIVGVTIDRTTATTLASRLIGVVGSSLVARLFDINADLVQDPLVACDALSVTLRVGGVVDQPDDASP